LGKRKPSFCTSAGKAILAFQPEIAKQVAKQLTSYTERTITDPILFFKDLEKIKKTGYVICIREYREHITSLGVPVYNDIGQVVASISMTMDYERASDQLQRRYVPLLQQAANELTKIIRLRKRS